MIAVDLAIHPQAPKSGATASRLTFDQVRWIRRVELSSGCKPITLKTIARAWGVSPHTLREVRRGRSYRWVGG